jgi:hypothetical protein
VAWAARERGEAVSRTVRFLADRGLLGSKRSTRPDVVAGYERFVRARAAFDRFAAAMRARVLKTVCGSAVHAALHITDRAHGGSHWTSTVGELTAHLGGCTEPAGAFAPLLGADDNTPVLVLPAVVDGRLVGLWVAARVDARGVPNFHYLRAAGESGGVTVVCSDGRFENATAIALPVAVRSDPVAFARILAADVRGTGTRAVTVLLGGPVDHEVVGAVRGYTSGDSAAVVVPDTAAGLQLAARLDLPVRPEPVEEPVRWETLVTSEQFFDALRHGKYPWSVVQGLWTPAVAHRAVAAGWVTTGASTQLSTRLARARRGPRRDRLVEVRRGLTVDTSGPVWYWSERGIALTAAVPVVERVYRGDDRRVRYRGHVVHGDRIYPFDSPLFRRDPVRVIEGAVLRAGDAPPAIHPAVGPYLGAVALYVREIEFKRTSSPDFNR